MTKVLGLPPALWLLYANLALYAVCYQAQQPALPYILKQLSSDATTAFASFRSFFWMIQLVGSVISGVLIDTLGVKVVIILSFLSSAVSYAMTAYATDNSSLSLLWAGAAPTVFQHAMLGAKAYVALVTPEEGPQRAAYIGYTGVAYGLGMVIGPVIGGWLSSQGLALAAWAAAVGSLISVVSIALFLDVPSVVNKSGSEMGGSKPELSWATLRSALSSPALLPLLTVKTLTVTASSIFENGVRVSAETQFGLDVQGMGYLLSWVGAMGTVASMFLVSPVTAHFQGRDGTLFLGSTILMAVLFAAFSMTKTAMQLFVIIVPMVAVSTVLNTANTAALTRAAPGALVGTVVSADMAIGSASRALAPAACAAILAQAGFQGIGAASSASMTLAVLLLASGTTKVDAWGAVKHAVDARKEV